MVPSLFVNQLIISLNGQELKANQKGVESSNPSGVYPIYSQPPYENNFWLGLLVMRCLQVVQ